MMPEKLKTTYLIIVFITLSLACCVFYSNSLHNPFIWDDEALVVKNPVIQSWHNLPGVFSSDLYSAVALGTNFYRPLQVVSYIWDYHFWQLDPYGYHLTNIALQILVSFLVFLFGYIIFKNRAIAFSASLLFALNPLHTEAVTYISGRAEMLMGLGLLLSFILFVRGYRALSWVSFILALLSKELAIAFPLIILAYLFYYRKDILTKGGSFIKLVLPFLAIDFIYLVLRFTSLHFIRNYPPALTKYPLLIRITVLPEVILTYLKLLFVPVGLHMSWTTVRPTTFTGYFLNLFLLGMLCVACGVILKNKSNKNFAFLLFWSLVFFLPQSGLLPINAFVAEHFIYLPSISFFLLVAYLLHRYLRKSLFIFSVLGLAVFYGMLTFTRNSDWKEPLIFYKKIIRFSPDSFQAHNNLGLEYERHLVFDLAISEYKRALEIEPKVIEIRSNLANLYFKTGKFKEAREEYALVEKVVPPKKAGELQNNIGCVYEVEGLLDQALERYKLALRLDPKLNFAHFNIARVYLTEKKGDLAVQEVLESLPEIKTAPSKKNRYLDPIVAYIKELKSTPPAKDFYTDLGVKFASYGLFDAAIAAFKRVIELTPFIDDAHFNLGLAYWKNGLKKDAIFEFKKTLGINPNHLKAKGLLYEIIRRK